jgi:hypothetical protein
MLGAFALALADRVRLETEESIGHTGAAAAALVTIAHFPDRTVEFLRQAVGLSHPAAVRVVDRLVDDPQATGRRWRSGPRPPGNATPARSSTSDGGSWPTRSRNSHDRSPTHCRPSSIRRSRVLRTRRAQQSVVSAIRGAAAPPIVPSPGGRSNWAHRRLLPNRSTTDRCAHARRRFRPGVSKKVSARAERPRAGRAVSSTSPRQVAGRLPADSARASSGAGAAR